MRVVPAIQPDAPGRALILLYRRAHTIVRSQIEAAIRRGNLGTERQRRTQLMAIEAVMANLERDQRGILVEAVRRPYGAAAIATDVTMGLSPRAFRFEGVHEQAVRVGIEALAGRLENARVNVGRYTNDLFREFQLLHATEGIAVGDTRRDVTTRMITDLRNHGVTAFVDKAHRRWSLERYATMTVRTNTREMVTLATVNRLTDNRTDLIAVSQHRGACPICLPWQGRTYSLSGEDARYPKVETHDGRLWLPPFHPQCEHVAHPAQATFEDFERELAAADVPPLPT